MLDTSNKNLNHETQKKDLLSIKPKQHGYTKNKRFLKAVVLFSFVLIVIAGWVFFIKNEDSAKKPTTSVQDKRNNELAPRITANEFDQFYTKQVDNYVKQNDFERAYQMCSTIASQYYVVSKFKDAKDSLSNCSFRISKKSPIPWFIYKDQAYLDLKLDDKTSAKNNFNQAIINYKDVNFEPKNSIEILKQQVEKL